eukprot:1919873-Rhodomonas_salina.2
MMMRAPRDQTQGNAFRAHCSQPERGDMYRAGICLLPGDSEDCGCGSQECSVEPRRRGLGDAACLVSRKLVARITHAKPTHQ